MTERATLELVKVEGRSGWEVRQAPERRRKKHIDLKSDLRSDTFTLICEH